MTEFTPLSSLSKLGPAFLPRVFLAPLKSGEGHKVGPYSKFLPGDECPFIRNRYRHLQPCFAGVLTPISQGHTCVFNGDYKSETARIGVSFQPTKK